LYHENSDFESEFSKGVLRLFRKAVDENLYKPRKLPLTQKTLTFASVFWQNYQISKYRRTTKKPLGNDLTEYPRNINQKQSQTRFQQFQIWIRQEVSEIKKGSC